MYNLYPFSDPPSIHSHSFTLLNDRSQVLPLLPDAASQDPLQPLQLLYVPTFPDMEYTNSLSLLSTSMISLTILSTVSSLCLILPLIWGRLLLLLCIKELTGWCQGGAGCPPDHGTGQVAGGAGTQDSQVVGRRVSQ